MCIKNGNMIGLVMFPCHMFSSCCSWPNLLYILWFSLIFHYLKAGSVPCLGCKLMVPDLATRDCEYCWWFLLCSFFGLSRWLLAAALWFRMSPYNHGWGEYYSRTPLAQNDKHEYTKNIVLKYSSSTDFPVLILVCSVLAPALLIIWPL